MSATLQALIHELIKYDHKTITIEEAIDLFLVKSESKTTSQTMNFYRKQFKKIKQFFDENGIASVSQIDNSIMYKFVKEEKSKGLKNNSINKCTDCMVFALNYCYKLDYINSNPLKNYEKLPSDDVETITVDPDLLIRIFHYLKSQPRNFVSIQDLLIFMLLIDTGVRRNELIHIELCNIDVDKSRILLTKTKTHKNRFIYLSSKTMSILEDYLELRPESRCDYLFINHRFVDMMITSSKIDHLIDKIKKDLQIPKKVSISPHKFRHTYATIALNNGADLVHVQKLLGHTTLRETQKYTHKSDAILKNEHKLYTPTNAF